MRRLTNWVYLFAVLAINFTLTRPSPVDILFVTTIALTFCAAQVVTKNILILSALLLAWLGSLYVSSMSLTDNPEVTYYMVKITFAVSIAFCSALVAAHWDSHDIRTFLQFYIAATCIASCLGTVGFLLGIEELTWDGRAKALLDDPNMYGAFLIPGVFASMYMLSLRERPLLYLGTLFVVSFGIVLSFSRAAIVSCVIWGALYYLVLNRNNLMRAVFYAAATCAVIAVTVGLAAIIDPEVGAKIADRTTIAKDYDLGHGGRYSRYALSVPFILANPLGMGLLEIDRYFDEPIHNIWISSFLNYGWLAGFAFTCLILFTVAISWFNYRETRNPLCLTLFFCWASLTSCAFLHEAERWRHLWLFTGLVWGVSYVRLRRPVSADRPAWSRGYATSVVGRLYDPRPV